MMKMHRRAIRVLEGFSVFIMNLPFTIDRYGLGGIFQKARRVKDVYIPAKQNNKLRRYGFVRFWREEDARKSISLLDSRVIRGFKIRVYLARFGKGGVAYPPNLATKQQWLSGSHQKSRNEWRKKHPNEDREMSSHLTQDPLRVMKGEVNIIFKEWLSRSLICVSNEPRDIEVLSKLLVKDGCLKLYALSKYKFILTFESIDRLEMSLSNHGELDDWFYEVKKWDIYEVCESRRVWIEVFGVPPHGWTKKNFESIASLWGKVVCLESHIEDTISFESMKILIDSGNMRSIKGSIILHLDDVGYKIEVKEASCSVQINPQFIAPLGSSSMEVEATNRNIRHGEGQTSDVATNDEVAKIKWRNDHRRLVDNSEGEAKGTPNFEFEMLTGKHLEVNRDSLSGNCNSSVNTKTAQLSPIDSAEVIAKQLKKGGASQYVEENDEVVNGVANQNDGLGNEEPLSPPGFGRVSLEGCEVNSIPPGFQSQPRTETQSTHMLKSGKNQHESVGRRFTRSQVKKVKTSTKSMNLSSPHLSKGSREVSPQSSRSSKTTERMTKLAMESIEIGELLGLKIIENKEGAVKRITRGLKKAKKERMIKLTK